MVIEAMNGLPTFATSQGGPAEIIVDDISGFHIYPNNGDESVSRIGDIFSKCSTDGLYWDTISKAGPNVSMSARHGRSMQRSY